MHEVLIKNSAALHILYPRLVLDRRNQKTVMDNLILVVVLLYCFGFSSQGLVLQKPAEDSDPQANFYEVDIPNESDQRTSLDYLKNTKGNTELALIVLVPKDNQDYKVVLEKNEHYDKYVIVKTKPELLDLEPYTQHHVDKHNANKQMVMWLNLYCDMHPDCDKNKLNEELRKVRPYLEF